MRLGGEREKLLPKRALREKNNFSLSLFAMMNVPDIDKHPLGFEKNLII